jgi:hypothetical protein
MIPDEDLELMRAGESLLMHAGASLQIQIIIILHGRQFKLK